MRHFTIFALALLALACARHPTGTIRPEPTGPIPESWQRAFARVREPPLNDSEPKGTRVYRITRGDAWYHIQWIVWLRTDNSGGLLQARWPVDGAFPDRAFPPALSPRRRFLDREEARVLADSLDAMRQWRKDDFNTGVGLDPDMWLFEYVGPEGAFFEFATTALLENEQAVVALRGWLP